MGKVNIWRNEAHMYWAEETLYFWKITIDRSIDLVGFFEKTKEIFERNRCFSYQFYPVTGSIDIVIRSWIKNPKVRNDIRGEIYAEFEGIEVRIAEIDSIITHWVWGNDEEVFHEDSLPFGREIIESINYNNTSIEKYRNHIKPIETEKEGCISFFIFIPVPHSGHDHQQETFSKNLLQMLSKDNVQRVSMYISAQTNEVIIKGFFECGEFVKKFSKLINDISQSEISWRNKFHTESCVILNGESDSYFKDTLTVPSNFGGSTFFEDLLHQEESQYLEFKGAFSSNLKEYIEYGTHSKEPELEKKVLANIVGMLNTCENGRIVLGVFEMDNPHHTIFKGKNGISEVGKCLVIGLNSTDFFTCGRKEYNIWDEFLQYLQTKINNHIVPNPNKYLNILPHEVDGKTICVISVDSPESKKHFYKDKNNQKLYFERQQNSCVEIDIEVGINQ